MTKLLKRSESDMQTEIRQLEKLIENKNQALAPLKEKTAELQQMKAVALNQQQSQLQRTNNVAGQLIVVEQRFQSVSRN